MEQCQCNLFSEIYKHLLCTSHLNFMCVLPLRLSCVFIANYVPKCQMSSGPYGTILKEVSTKLDPPFKKIMVHSHLGQFSALVLRYKCMFSTLLLKQ